MQLRTNALVEAFPDLRKELGEKALATISPALIGMSLRQDIPGGLPSGRAHFRFSCQDHFGTEHPCYQQKRSERQSVPTCRVPKLDALYPVDSLRSQCSGSPGMRSMDVMPSSFRYIQQPGTLGTVGTGL